MIAREHPTACARLLLTPSFPSRRDEDSYTTMETCVYQQDGASTRRSGFTRSYLNEKGLSTIDWPTKSPDLNIVENIWAATARRLYLCQRQFDAVEKVKGVSEDVRATISGELLQKIYRSILRQMLAVLDGQRRARKH